LLIVHADDLGIAHAVNVAFIDGLETGLINSGSVIVLGRCFSQVAAFAQAHPAADIGLHLALTSDSAKEPWAPIASPTQVPSLVDQQGNFHENWTPETRINPGEVEIELRAQIEKANAAGLRPTHLDSHRFRLLLSGREVFEVYVRLGREYDLPVLVPWQWFARVPYLKPLLTQRDVVVDRMVIINGKVVPEQWSTFYRRALEDLPAGVSEFLIHPGYDNEELQTFFDGRVGWGAAWRQRDFDFFTSDEFRGSLKKYDIKLITWGEITAGLRRLSPGGRRMIRWASRGVPRRARGTHNPTSRALHE
jgi:chitin disaccharide deacetylase